MAAKYQVSDGIVPFFEPEPERDSRETFRLGLGKGDAPVSLVFPATTDLPFGRPGPYGPEPPPIRGTTLAPRPVRALRRTAAALAFVLAVAAPLTAGAQPDPYKQHMENGVKLYQDRNYPAALTEFRAAYQAKPNANPLVNIALCDKEMFRYPAAIQALKDALAKHGDAMVPADKKAAEDAIKEMEALLGTVTLTVAPHGATVLVDGEELRDGAADQPVKLGPGPHKIVVRADGYKTEERSVPISSGQSEQLAIALTPEEPTPPHTQGPIVDLPPPLPPEPPKKEPPPPVRGLYLLGLGAILFPATHATGWPDTKTDYGAAYGLRVGFQVNEVAGFEASYEHSSIDTLTNVNDPDAYYRIVSNRLALGLHLISPGHWVRFAGGFGGGFVSDTMVFVYSPGTKQNPVPAVIQAADCGSTQVPNQACPFTSGSGYDAFAMLEAGMEIDIEKVLIDLSFEGQFQATGGLQTNPGHYSNGVMYGAFSIFGAHPLVYGGPALRFGYRFW
jgi:hypothetical protein